MSPQRGSEDWRQQAPGGGTPQGNSPRSWRHAQPVAMGGTTRWRRVIKGGLAAVVVLASIALIIWLLQFRSRLRTDVFVAVTEYAPDGVLQNPFAAGDREALQALSGKQWLQTIEFSEIDPAKELALDSDADVFVLYLNVIAGVDDNGLFFYPRGAKPEDLSGLIREDRLWDALKSLKTQQHKLVLLDVSRVGVEWRMGHLAPIAWQRLSERAEAIDNLVVLSSCAPGQQSWASADLGQSVFGHYVAQGLSGKADVNGDGTVRVEELGRYVTAHTQHWVANNRDDGIGQTPVMFPSIGPNSEDDFEVFRPSGKTLPEPTDARLTPGDWDRLTRIWKDRDVRARDEAIRNPLAWNALNRLLMDAERSLLTHDSSRTETLLEQARKIISDPQPRWSPEDELESSPFWHRNLTPASTAGVGSVPQPDELLRAALDQFPNEFPVERSPGQNIDALGDDAVVLRQLAERAGNHPLGTTRWVRTEIADVDHRRYRAEDRLFTSDINPTEVQQTIQQSRANYQSSIETAQAVSNAAAVLSRLRLDLMQFAQWAAAREGDRQLHTQLIQKLGEPGAWESDQLSADLSQMLDDRRRMRDDISGTGNRLEIQGLKLFADARTLRQLLRSEDRTQITRITQLSEQVRESWDQIHKELLSAADGIAGPNRNDLPESPQPLHRRECVEILQYPLLPAEKRTALVERLQGLEAAMAKQQQVVALDANVREHGAQEAERISLTTFQRGQWNALWIVNILSLEPPPEFDNLVSLWTKTITDTRPDERTEQLQKLGTLVRSIWDSLPRRRPSLLAHERTPFEDYGADLELAFGWMHLVHGYDAGPLAATEHPAELLDKWRFVQRTLFLCDRHLNGFWADADRASLWYASVTEEALRMLERMNRGASLNADEEIQQRRTRIDELKRAVPGPNLRFAGLDKRGELRLSLTRTRATVPMQLEPAPVPLPEGHTAIWLFSRQPGLVDVERNGHAIDTSASTAAFEIERSAAIDTGNCASVSFQGSAFFRGHHWKSANVLEVQPCRESSRLVTYTPHQQTGSVVVNGTDERSIIFILDCSFSMKFEVPGTKNSKFSVAIDNLERIVKNELNPTDRAGLILFAHRVYETQNNRTENSNWEGEWLTTFGPINDDLRWNFDFQEIVPIDRMSVNKKRFQDWLNRLRTLGYHGNTPLVGAINYALDKQRMPMDGGTVIAITDGAANDYSEANPSRGDTLKFLLNERRARCYIVGFGFNPTEPDEIQQVAQLKSLAERVDAELLDAPGGQQLIAEVTKALRPRKFQVSDPVTSESWESDLSQPVVDLPAQDRRYRLSFADLTPVEFSISGGERFSFDINPVKRTLQRPPVEYKAVRPVVPSMFLERAPRFLACRTLEIGSDRRVRLVLSLDDSDEPFVRRPREIEFEISPAGARTSKNMSWKLLADQGVPTWEFLIEDWQPGQPVEATAFWKFEHTPPDVTFRLPDLRGHVSSGTAREFELVRGLPPLRLFAQDDGRQIEFVLTVDPTVPLSESSASPLETLAIELGQITPSGAFEPFDLAWNRDYSDDDQSLFITFELPGNLNRDEVVLGLTSRRSRKIGSDTIEQPLLIRNFDRVGKTTP